MKKSINVVPQLYASNRDFSINTINNRTILVEDRGRIVFTKEITKDKKKKVVNNEK